MEKFSWLEFDKDRKCLTREPIIFDAPNLTVALFCISSRYLLNAETVDVKVWRIHLAKT